jgi:putative phosphotransacetylase
LNKNKTIPVGITNRHFHISQHDLETLFGRGYRLTRYRDISQSGQFAANETIDVAGPAGKIEKIRIVGPTRPRTQLELAPSDAFHLGISPPVRYSGDLDGSAGATLVGPAGKVDIKEGVILPIRHIHMSPSDARTFEVFDGARVIVAPAISPGFSTQNEPRRLVFDNVLIRVNPRFVLDFHIDIDEANASGLKNGDRAKIIGFSELNNYVPKAGLITENDVRRAIMAKNKIAVGPATKLTPAARDLGKEHGVFT